MFVADATARRSQPILNRAQEAAVIVARLARQHQRRQPVRDEAPVASAFDPANYSATVENGEIVVYASADFTKTRARVAPPGTWPTSRYRLGEWSGLLAIFHTTGPGGVSVEPRPPKPPPAWGENLVPTGSAPMDPRSLRALDKAICDRKFDLIQRRIADHRANYWGRPKAA